MAAPAVTRPQALHQARLLECGREYFPAIIAAIEGAQHEVLLETYIYADDPSGRAVSEALLRAVARGVRVVALIDGFGADGHIGSLAERLRSGGVSLRFYRPLHRITHLRRSRLRRLHRKLVTIDASLTFVGGINIHDDLNLPEPGLAGRFDFAVAAAGPLVRQVRSAQRRLAGRALRRAIPAAPPSTAPAGAFLPAAFALAPVAHAALVLRDNLRHRHAIERVYLRAIATARESVWIANAYFVPGHRVLAALKDAARRGVDVRLILQGREEYWIAREAERALYDILLDAGIDIVEYGASFLHAKVAVIDRRWATVGSSNLDPFSLLLAHEANLVIEDATFASDLYSRLERACADHGQRIDASLWQRRPRWLRLRARLIYGLARLALRALGLGGYLPRTA